MKDKGTNKFKYNLIMAVPRIQNRVASVLSNIGYVKKDIDRQCDTCFSHGIPPDTDYYYVSTYTDGTFMFSHEVYGGKKVFYIREETVQNVNLFFAIAAMTNKEDGGNFEWWVDETRGVMHRVSGLSNIRATGKYRKARKIELINELGMIERDDLPSLNRGIKECTISIKNIDTYIPPRYNMQYEMYGFFRFHEDYQALPYKWQRPTSAYDTAGAKEFTIRELWGILFLALKGNTKEFWEQPCQANRSMDNGYYFNMCRDILMHYEDSDIAPVGVVVIILQVFGEFTKIVPPKDIRYDGEVCYSDKPSMSPTNWFSK